jgi:hypothetical protein
MFVRFILIALPFNSERAFCHELRGGAMLDNARGIHLNGVRRLWLQQFEGEKSSTQSTQRAHKEHREEL